MTKTEVLRLDDTLIEVGGSGKKKESFSLSGANDGTYNFLYFGVHGSYHKIELSDSDLVKLETVVKELRNASSISPPRRINNDRR